jgi:hypothetical protein
MGTGSFPGVKQPGHGADHPPSSSTEVMKGYSYTSNHPLGQFRPVTGISLSLSLSVTHTDTHTYKAQKILDIHSCTIWHVTIIYEISGFNRAEDKVFIFACAQFGGWLLKFFRTAYQSHLQRSSSARIKTF